MKKLTKGKKRLQGSARRKIRRSLLLAVKDYDVASLQYVIKHHLILSLNADIEILRIEWHKLIKYGYLIPIIGHDNAVKLPKEQIEAIEKTKLPTQDEFLFDNVVEK